MFRPVRALTVTLATLVLLLGAVPRGAEAAPCPTGSINPYFSPGFSCEVGPMTFAGFDFGFALIAPDGSASISLGGNVVSLFQSGNEFGLTFSYPQTASGANAFVGTSLDFDVVGSPSIADVFLSFTAAIIDSAQATASVALNNGQTLSLAAPGSASLVFAPVPSVHAEVHHDDTATGGTATSTSFTIAFSVPATIPEPATLTLLGLGLVGIGVWRRRSDRH